MKFNNKILVFSLTFSVLLPFIPVTQERSLYSEDYRKTPAIPASGLRQRQLTPISVSPIILEGTPVGFMITYEDQRAAPYLEIYDEMGELVAINWFDQFGIERLAIDRGFLQNASKLEGVFVIFTDGVEA